ncbi:MAG: AbrB/MazE/SpoVT family DNA-binding domain-containing protein [Novosphingobium sp.]
MTREWTTKTFKSGNSVAMRLPKALGISEGDEVVIVPHADGSLSIWKDSDTKRVFLSLYGSMSPGFMSEGRGDIEQDDYDWDGPSDRPAAA